MDFVHGKWIPAEEINELLEAEKKGGNCKPSTHALSEKGMRLKWGWLLGHVSNRAQISFQ